MTGDQWSIVVVFFVIVGGTAAVVGYEVYRSVYLGEVEKTDPEVLCENTTDLIVVEMKMEQPDYFLLAKNWVFTRTQYLSYPWEKFQFFTQMCGCFLFVIVVSLTIYGLKENRKNRQLYYLHHKTDKSITLINLFRHSVELRLAKIKELNLVRDESHYVKMVSYLKELAENYSFAKATLDDYIIFKEKLVEFQFDISDSNLDYTLFDKIENFKNSMKADVDANIKRNKWKKK